MRYLRLLILGISSFVVSLSAGSFKAMVTIPLCGILSICPVNKYLSAGSQLSSAQAAVPFGSGEKISIPPIIREAPIDLQNSLADDFIVSRQTPYNSGRNEVLVISPSTGTEQRFEISLPTGGSFQLYKASFSKVSVGDPSEIAESSDPGEVQRILESFAISFDSNNLVSELTLADGSQIEFLPTEAVIHAADGEVVENVPFSNSSLSDSVSAALPKSLDMTKPAVDKLAQSPRCESGIRDQLYAASQDIGRKSNALRNASSIQGRAASWVSAFGKRALEDSLVSETRNQTLQEIACVPPIECDEQQDYEGASEIRTDLFKIPGSAGQQVDIRYQFYDIPDRMEIYYQGELVDSIPRGSGRTNGSSQLSVQLPGGADFVGVKLIGNEDKDTRWNYTISCSAECETQVAASPRLDESRDPRAEWNYILEKISDYREDNLNNSDAVAFSQQMYNLADGAYRNRAENDGWAGEFTRNTLLTAAWDIANDRDFWDSPPTSLLTGSTFRNSQIGWWTASQCDTSAVVRIAIRNTCAFSRAGDHHIERHLKPAFKQSIKEKLAIVANNDCLTGQALIDEFKPAILSIEEEHSKLLNTVLVPGLESLPISGKKAGALNIPRVAADLREDALHEVLQVYVDQGRISEEEADTIRIDSPL